MLVTTNVNLPVPRCIETGVRTLRKEDKKKLEEEEEEEEEKKKKK